MIRHVLFKTAGVALAGFLLTSVIPAAHGMALQPLKCRRYLRPQETRRATIRARWLYSQCRRQKKRNSAAVNLSAGGPYRGQEGRKLTLTASLKGAPDSNVRFSWDLNSNGRYETKGASARWIPPDNGAYLIRVKARNVLTHETDTAVARIRIKNLAPSVSIRGPSSGMVEQSISFTALASDPGPADRNANLVYNWEFSDGSPALNSLGASSVTHTYRAAGRYTVFLVVQDKDGASSPQAKFSLVISSPELPAIPDLSLWESQMISYGRSHCQQLSKPGRTFDQELLDTYYDAQRVYYQIADYTNDASWNTCAQAAERIYRDKYVIPNNYRVPGYWNFTHGLAQDFLRTNDKTSRTTAISLSQQAAFAPDTTPLEWTRDSELSREVAYAIISYLNSEEVGASRRARLTSLVDQALGHLDQWFVSKSAPYVRPFMAGLTAEALIAYCETLDQPEARIVRALTVAMDWLWEHTWLPEEQAFMYTDREVNSGGKEPAPDLNLLIAPAFAWLYRLTGEQRFLERGDQVFSGGVKKAYLIGGKQFNQNYRWSFDYIKWRSSIPLANSLKQPGAGSTDPTAAGDPTY